MTVRGFQSRFFAEPHHTRTCIEAAHGYGILSPATTRSMVSGSLDVSRIHTEDVVMLIIGMLM